MLRKKAGGVEGGEEELVRMGSRCARVGCSHPAVEQADVEG